MRRKFTLEYWIDEGWYVGRLKEIPGVFSQGENLEELKENIIDAYKLVMSEGKFELEVERKETEIEVEVWKGKNLSNSLLEMAVIWNGTVENMTFL